MSDIVLAADLGGTNLRIAAVTKDGQLMQRNRMPTPDSRRSADIISAITDLAEKCRSGLDNGLHVKALCVATPAIINSTDGTIINAPNLPELNGVDLAGELSARLGLPVSLENDANAAAVGENWLGASKDVANSICVTLGTGVGGGLILNGKLFRGVDGTAGEVGHINVEPEGHPCGCGSRGCLEQYASATAIIRLTKLFASHHPDSSLNKNDDTAAADVYNAGLNGDKLALEVFRVFGRYLGIALSGLVNVLNPEAIILGGGVSAGWELFIDHVRHEVRERAFRLPGERARLIRASLADDAGILGSARLAFDLERS